MKNTTSLFIALVWIVNGLFCKVLNMVPRHELIVSIIIGSNQSYKLTILIGVLEVLMAVWILSGVKPKINAIVQIVIIATMNIIEFLLAQDLLLWGKFNSVFALLLIIVIYYSNFQVKNKPKNQNARIF